MERYLVDQFSTLDGVANVRMNGARRYAMRVWLLARESRARQLTVNDVENSLLRENVELPAGRLESSEREFTLRTDTNLRTEEDFRNLVVGRGPDGYLVRLAKLPKCAWPPTMTAACRGRMAPSVCRWPSSRSQRRTCSPPQTR